MLSSFVFWQKTTDEIKQKNNMPTKFFKFKNFIIQSNKKFQANKIAFTKSYWHFTNLCKNTKKLQSNFDLKSIFKKPI